MSYLGQYPNQYPGTQSPTPTGEDPSQTEEWIQMGQDAKNLWESLTGRTPRTPWGTAYNNAPYQLCADTPNFDAVLRAVQRAPESEIATLVHYLRDANGGQGPRTREELSIPKYLPNWTKAIMGGKDCRATRFPDAPEWFRGFVSTYGAPTSAEEARPGGGVFEPGSGFGGAIGGSDLGPLLAAGVALFFVPKLLK